MQVNLSSSTITFILAVFIITSGVFFTWIIRTKTKDNIELTSTEKIKQHVVFALWLMPLVILAFIAGAFLAQHDAAWHQIAHRAGEIQSERIIIYVIFYPAYLMIAASAWLYASTRFNEDFFNFQLKIALLGGSLSPFMFLPAQDTDVMVFSADLDNIIYRISYWIISFIWIASIGYLTARQAQRIFTLLQENDS